jgi:hypothetical protein
MPASVLTDALRDLWGPGLVFLALCGWLVRRALRAARNESILEEQRLRDALGQTGVSNSNQTSKTTPTSNTTSTPTSTSNTTSTSTSNPNPTSTPTPTPTSSLRLPPQLSRADVRGALQEHIDVVARLIVERDASTGGRRTRVLWVRSNATHAAWAESRLGNPGVICVAQIEDGKVVARWQFG